MSALRETFDPDALGAEADGAVWPEPLAVRVSPDSCPTDALPPAIGAAVRQVAGFVKAPSPPVASSVVGALSVAGQALCPTEPFGQGYRLECGRPAPCAAGRGRVMDAAAVRDPDRFGPDARRLGYQAPEQATRPAEHCRSGTDEELVRGIDHRLWSRERSLALDRLIVRREADAEGVHDGGAA